MSYEDKGPASSHDRVQAAPQGNPPTTENAAKAAKSVKKANSDPAGKFVRWIGKNAAKMADPSSKGLTHEDVNSPSTSND